MANASFGRAVGKVIKPTTIASEAETARAIVSEDLPPLASLDEFHGDPNFMMSLARGLLVIQAFSERRLQLSISQLSKRTTLSRASVRRCLHTLSKLGFAGTDDGRSFYLRPRVLALGHSYLSSMPLATAAQPILEHLSQILHESCSIALLDGTEIVYVARAHVTRIMAIDLGVGTRLPAFCTSMGRVLLANLPPDELETVLPKIEFTRYTDRTVSSVEKLRQVLVTVRREGHAIIDQELELGLRSMAVPVRNPAGRVVAAINVGAHGQRVSIQDMRTRFLPYLHAAAQELCLMLN
ncbi:MAG TPA: IclR family transcriptional regulator C-terminal domain-containing protein [Candidatus Acidoferrum sp.]|jgi:IclR family pca regulon transcriptional regulator|nr:IclR family transcriptional regulator C-terminal domain-containing protein [Candidatus Acidoferrum sp.]